MTNTHLNTASKEDFKQTSKPEPWINHQGEPQLFFLSNRDKVLHAAIVVDARRISKIEIQKFAQICSILQVTSIVYALSNLSELEDPQSRFNLIDEFATEQNGSPYIVVPTSDSDLQIERINRWYKGATLEQIHARTRNINTNDQVPLRIPIAQVGRSNDPDLGEYHFYEGTVSGGSVKVGDTLLALPLNRIAQVKLIVENRRAINRAHSGQTVQIYLDAPLPVRSGDMFVKLNVDYPHYSSTVSALVRLNPNQKLNSDRSVELKHTTEFLRATIRSVRTPFTEGNDDNWIVVTFKSEKPIKFDSYVDNCTTGSIELIDKEFKTPIGFGFIISEPEMFSFNI
jgi:sulfate adenylyltransferase subunit 1 (EFTu-like GTPase family)